MLGERPVDACYWESFGKGWKEDAWKYLELKDTREFKAEYGQLPDLASTNPDHDILFTYNGTTSGVRVPNLDWVSNDRKGANLFFFEIRKMKIKKKETLSALLCSALFHIILTISLIYILHVKLLCMIDTSYNHT